MTTHRPGASSTWPAVATAGALSVVGLIFVGAAFLTTYRDCSISLGCDSGSSPLGVAFFVAAAIALAFFAAASVLAARLSGRPAPAATASLALGAFVGTMVLGGVLLHAFGGEWILALVPALEVQAAVAVRPVSPGAVRIRVAFIVGSLLLLAASPATFVLLVLAAVPLIGVADSVAAR
jgi:hypothetical protein